MPAHTYLFDNSLQGYNSPNLTPLRVPLGHDHNPQNNYVFFFTYCLKLKSEITRGNSSGSATEKLEHTAMRLP